MWTPITYLELYDEIYKSESELNGELWNFWQLIKIEPQKWEEETYGREGGGFWVVAICGKRIIWYNDIEEGFNISGYEVYGRIGEYFCDQDQLNWSVGKLYNLIKFAGQTFLQRGQAQPLK